MGRKRRMYHILNGLWAGIPWCCIKFWNAGNTGVTREHYDPLCQVAQYVRCDPCVKRGHMKAIRFNGRICHWLIQPGSDWYNDLSSGALKLLWIMPFLVSCGSTPYFDLGAGYQSNKGDFAPVVLIDNEWITGEGYDVNCTNISAAIGTEWGCGWSAELEHISCINPNMPMEQSMNNFMIKKRTYWRRQ